MNMRFIHQNLNTQEPFFARADSLQKTWLVVLRRIMLAGLIAGVLGSCIFGGEDTEPPRIDAQSLALFGFPQDADTLSVDALSSAIAAPGELQIRVALSDNQNLDAMPAQLTTAQNRPPGKFNIFPQARDTVFNIGGNRTDVIRSLVLPPSLASGTYQFSFCVRDDAGNASQSETYPIEVRNALPILELIQPLDDSLSLAVGQTLGIGGAIQAQAPIRELRIQAIATDTVIELLQQNNLPAVTDFGQNISFGEGTERDYLLRISATDTTGRTGIIGFRLNIR